MPNTIVLGTVEDTFHTAALYRDSSSGEINVCPTERDKLGKTNACICCKCDHRAPRFLGEGDDAIYLGGWQEAEALWRHAERLVLRRSNWNVPLGRRGETSVKNDQVIVDRLFRESLIKLSGFELVEVGRSDLVESTLAERGEKMCTKDSAFVGPFARFVVGVNVLPEPAGCEVIQRRNTYRSHRFVITCKGTVSQDPLAKFSLERE